ncbi:MAG: DUF5678 domain-containing protein [Chloroflexota bacterium]|nr:DUF5678 domain-containing protein [Chloroflexota bacterium]
MNAVKFYAASLPLEIWVSYREKWTIDGNTRFRRTNASRKARKSCSCPKHDNGSAVKHGRSGVFSKNSEKQQKIEAEKISTPPEFAQEVAAFERLKPELLKKYPQRVVAIHQGQVVAVGDNRMDVLGILLDRLGPVPCYIEWVEQETPRRVRMPSIRVVR